MGIEDTEFVKLNFTAWGFASTSVLSSRSGLLPALGEGNDVLSSELRTDVPNGHPRNPTLWALKTKRRSQAKGSLDVVLRWAVLTSG